MVRPNRCPACESDEIASEPLDMPDQIGRWKFLLEERVVYSCANGHRFLMLPDERARAETFL
jgi:hypothetical protein